uniref:SPX domain-containing protein n=1 Tax=Aegilops tauschii subsp. strangulata TaxID=200361 RepID=A0A453Q0H1_AEGTS
RGLELLKKFSSLNVKAFTKILKKFVKVSEQQRATDLFSQKVKRSSFSTSDKVLQLSDEVEALFLKHFAGNDRMVAMKYLNPQQPKNTHMITFLVGRRARRFRYSQSYHVPVVKKFRIPTLRSLNFQGCSRAHL